MEKSVAISKWEIFHYLITGNFWELFILFALLLGQKNKQMCISLSKRYVRNNKSWVVEIHAKFYK